MSRLWIIWSILFLVACTNDEGIDGYRYRLVVEGWIEEGNVPYVILSQNKPLISIIDSTSIDDMIIRWAKVTVSDGEKTEVLRGRVDRDYFPPFIYRGIEMQGVAGKTYTLTVEYSGHVWTAKTTIPESVQLTSLDTKTVSGQDTLYSIYATFNDPESEKNYYKFFTRIRNKSGRYLPAMMGNFDDNMLNGKKLTVPVNQGIDMREIEKFSAYFNVKDTVYVKFCTMSEFDFDFWTAYENEQMNSQNPFFPANQNLPSNISSGRGCWCGYGKNIYMIWHKNTVATTDNRISIHSMD